VSDADQNSSSESDAAQRASRNVEPPSGKRQYSCLSCFVLLVIAFLAIGLLLPAIGAPREAGRSVSCLNKVHQLGGAMQEYASQHNNAYPASAEIVQSPNGKKVGGYSFLVKLLPYMKYDYLYKTLPQNIPNGDLDSALATNRDLATAMNASLREFVCPSNNNNIFHDPNSYPPRFAFTNYKALGASTRDSLIAVVNPSAAQPYGKAANHPDGAMFPSAGDLPMKGIQDGLSHTIFLTETIDDRASRWMVGAECTLVGLPQASSPTAKQLPAPYPFFAPRGFDMTWGDGSAVSIAGLRTFLMYDFSPSGDDVGKYEDPGWSNVPTYGPSSAHPAIAVVGFGDGSVTALYKRCDAANLFFLITKDNNDPFNLP
jgi:hypothetical protein